MKRPLSLSLRKNEAISMQKRIEICGGIAAGKTSLAMVLEQEGFVAVYEKFDANPFLNDFYVDKMLDNTFETEITFALLHYNWIKERSMEERIVCDYALFQDWCYGKNNLSEQELSVFENVYKHLNEQIVSPALTIYLQCGVDCLLERIKMRGRVFEQSISRSYLEENIQILEKELNNKENVLVIESDKYNFISDDKDLIVKTILEKYNSIK